jgi:exonuclease SbcC
MTNDAYKVSGLDDDFNLTLVRDEQLEMPVELLSSGTYDSVALALRLAILENILGDNKGFVVLDDCLVDLDPYRKEKAVEIIKEFAKRHQVIFVTCSPDTAQLLGGKIIEM